MLILSLVIFTGANAQSALQPATDTLTNAATRNLSMKITGSNNVLTFQLNMTNISGTTAGTAFVQGSLDGVRFTTLKGTDTVTLSNSVLVKTWEVARSNYSFYQIHVIGTGTQSTQLKGYALFRP